MYSNVFYFYNINQIGGIESFFYYLVKKYCNYDITIFYKVGDIDQIKRLKKYVRVKKYQGEHIVCDKAFFNFNLDIIDNVEAKEYIQIAHGDYKAMGIKPNTHPKITKYLGVSKQVCDTFKELTGFDTELAYNPIDIEKPKKVLNLISATRLTKEKGKDRIVKLANILDNASIPYQWTIFTNDTKVIDNENIIYMKPKLDIINYIANADYLVQLSDNEGYCYSVAEALSVGTPVIVTECPVFKEIGVKDKENGLILDFDLSNVPVEKIYKGLSKFEYIPKKDNWDDILVKNKSTYKEELKMRFKVEALATYETNNLQDAELKRIPKAGEQWEVSKERLEILLGDNKYGLIFVQVIEELKQPEKIEIETSTIKSAKKKSNKKK